MRVVLDTNVFVSMTLGGQVGKINDTAEVVSVVIARIERKAEFVLPRIRPGRGSRSDR
jgi:hypothetical protein